MTVQTEISTERFQQAIIVRTMCGMAAITLTIAEGLVGDRIIGPRLLVTTETEIAAGLRQQIRVVRRMGVVTTAAVTFTNRCMKAGFAGNRLGNFFVTPQAKFLLGLEQQLFMSRNVRTMAGQTILISNG
jgi:hypothetical protein